MGFLPHIFCHAPGEGRQIVNFFTAQSAGHAVECLVHQVLCREAGIPLEEFDELAPKFFIFFSGLISIRIKPDEQFLKMGGMHSGGFWSRVFTHWNEVAFFRLWFWFVYFSSRDHSLVRTLPVLFVF